jgi:hypothetical protein
MCGSHIPQRNPHQNPAFIVTAFCVRIWANPHRIAEIRVIVTVTLIIGKNLEFSTAKTAFAETKAWLHRRQHRG